MTTKTKTAEMRGIEAATEMVLGVTTYDHQRTSAARIAVRSAADAVFLDTGKSILVSQADWFRAAGVALEGVQEKYTAAKFARSAFSGFKGV